MAQQLVEYDFSSSENESDDNSLPGKTKNYRITDRESREKSRTCSGQLYKRPKKMKASLSITEEQNVGDENKQTLSIPPGILNMFKSDEIVDENSHDGRVRSFAHFPGNWATHVYIKVQISYEIEDLVSSLVEALPDLLQPQMHLIPKNEVHISLSRTVPIRHYWIDPLVEQLKSKLETKKRFFCSFGRPQFYVNDDHTRSFLGVTVCSGREQLAALVTVVDDVFKEFALQEFYKKPSFHASVAWCLGDVFSQCSEPLVEAKVFAKVFAILCRLLLRQKALSHVASENDELSVYVNEVLCKIGNRTYSFPLHAPS